MTKFNLIALSIMIIGCGGNAVHRPTTPSGDASQVCMDRGEYDVRLRLSEESRDLTSGAPNASQRRDYLEWYVAEALGEEPPGLRYERMREEICLSRDEYTDLSRSVEQRLLLIAPHVSDEEREAALAAARTAREESRTAAATPPPAAPPGASGSYLAGFAPPGVVTETTAYAGGSAPWTRFGGSTGGQEIVIRVDSAYAIAIAIDGQVIQPVSGGMPLAVPAYTGGGLTTVPVLPATRSGGWSGGGTVREYRVLSDSVGRRELSWTCYSVVSGRAGRRAGGGARPITVRPGVRVMINDSMCR